MAFQSRVGPVEWLTPYTDDKLRELGRAGVKQLVVVPISFVQVPIDCPQFPDWQPIVPPWSLILLC